MILLQLKGLPLDSDEKPSRDPRLLLQAAQQEASRMSMLVQQGGSHGNVLSRSVSSVENATCTPPPLPKRAATIGAFETKGLYSLILAFSHLHRTKIGDMYTCTLYLVKNE